MNKRPISERMGRFLALFFWIACWELAAHVVHIPYIFAAPSEVLLRLIELCGELSFWQTLATSFFGITAGLLIALIGGITLAYSAHLSQMLRTLIEPLIYVMKAVPVASFVIVVLLWLPSRYLSLVISCIMALPLVFEHTLLALHTLDQDLMEMAYVFQIPFQQRFVGMYLPHALPHMRAMLNVCIGLSWKSGIAAELIGIVHMTIGAELYQAKMLLDAASVFAWTVALVLLSVSVHMLVRGALEHLERMICGRS